MLLCASECCVFTKEQMRKIETAKIRFRRSVAGCSMFDHKHDENIWEELGVRVDCTTTELLIELATTFGTKYIKT